MAPQTLTFTYTQGNANPAPQSFSVFGSGANVSYTATAASAGGSWLTVSGSPSQTPGVITVSVNPTGLAPNTSPYTGTVSVTPAGSSQPVTVAVSLSVTAAAVPPSLSVTPSYITLSLVQGSAPAQSSLIVTNSGGGNLSFNVSVTNPPGWLSLSCGNSGMLAALAQQSLCVKLDPTGLQAGLYSGQLVVNGPGKPVTVPVALQVQPSTDAMQLTLNGTTFTAVEGEITAQTQNFAVINSGPNTINWSAQPMELSGGGWLNVTQQGTSGAGGSSTKGVITVNPQGLKAGQYYGSIQVTSTDVTNSPQVIPVQFNVAEAGSELPVTTSPTGILLVATQGQDGGTQQLNLINPNTDATVYTCTLNSVDGSNPGLGAGPPTGTIPGLEGVFPMEITGKLSTLSAGVQQSELRFGFTNHTNQVVEITTLVIPPAASPNPSPSKSGKVRPQGTGVYGCGASGSLIGTITGGLNNHFQEVSGTSPVITATVTDPCGNAITGTDQYARVTLLIDGGVSPSDIIPMAFDTNQNVWTGTWPVGQPETATTVDLVESVGTAPDRKVGVLGKGPVTPYTGQIVAAGTPQTGTGPRPIVGGFLNAASFQGTNQGAVGGFISIFGSGLAGSTLSASSLPLPKTLNGTKVMLGNTELTLDYVSDGQVNALLPQTGFTANQQLPLTVVNGTAVSTATTLTLSDVQPGIFTVPGTTQGAIELVKNSALADASNPASAGDYIAIYCTGLGAVSNPPADGAAVTDGSSTTVNTVNVTIGNVPATVVYAGLAPYFAGVYQVNAQVPQGVAPGDSVPMQITMKAQQSNVATIAVQ